MYSSLPFRPNRWDHMRDERRSQKVGRAYDMKESLIEDGVACERPESPRWRRQYTLDPLYLISCKRKDLVIHYTAPHFTCEGDLVRS